MTIARTIPAASFPEAGSATIRVCAYYRVSTGRQAESDLSIPDQRLQISTWCLSRGWSLVAEYTEAGASGMEEDRTEFQRMIERATGSDRPFDVVVVHSFSRFFRDAFGLKCTCDALPRQGSRLSPSRRNSVTIPLKS